jgi:hypothetical protein
MGIYRQPFFRKTIVPWYDGNLVCALQIALMTLVLLFGCLGISVAGEIPEPRGIIWVPALLVALSLTVLASTILRLIRRRERESE